MKDAIDDLTAFFDDAEFMDLAEKYLHDLETSDGLRVILVPPREEMNSGGKIRAAESQNPEWYRRFAGQFTNCRGRGRKRMKRPRTFIDRRRVVTALRRILAGDRSGATAERLTSFIQSEIENERSKRRAIEAADGDDWNPF